MVTKQGASDRSIEIDALNTRQSEALRVVVCGNSDGGDLIDRLQQSTRNLIVSRAGNGMQDQINALANAFIPDVAIFVIDAGRGMSTQIKRQAYLISSMGVRHAVLAIDIGFAATEESSYRSAKDAFEAFFKALEFDTVISVPISASHCHNIIERSQNAPWYVGQTLMEYLDRIEAGSAQDRKLAFSVSEGCDRQTGIAACAGTLIQGSVSVGDEVRMTTTGQRALVKQVVILSTHTGGSSGAGESVSLVFDREVKALRGDIISLSQLPLEITDQFEATIIWLDKKDGLTGRQYRLDLANQSTQFSITNIKYRVDVATLAHEASKTLTRNDIYVCNVATAKPVVYDSYKKTPPLGYFTITDRVTNARLAVGMVTHSLRRSQNVHKQALSISYLDRVRLNGHKGIVIWFTGLSGSGKSTIANALETALHAQGKRTYILDGDNIRQGLNKDLGFTDADRVENIRRVAEVANLMRDAGVIVITAFISPFQREREMARELIGRDNFVEVFVDTPLDECERRDPKGLYKKARNGLLPNMTGIDSPYEQPLDPQAIINTQLESLDESVSRLIKSFCSS